MKMTPLTPLAAVLGLAAFVTSSTIQAQNVTLGSPQLITGDNNLIDAANTPGVVDVDAILPNGNRNNGVNTGASITADGVTFNAATFSTTSTSDGTITLTAAASPGTYSSGSFSQYGNNGGGFPVSGSASASFAAVQTVGGVFGTAGVITISSAALTAGTTYDVQIFNYSNDGANESTTFTSGGSSVTLVDDDGAGNGYFTTGTFTATGANEVIDFSYASGPYTPVVGAINVVATPEPSTSLLMLGGMLCVVFGMRHRRQATA